MLAALAVMLAAPALVTAPAFAQTDDRDQWLPRSDGAEWVYEWTNSAYSPTPRRERYSVDARRGESFRVAWEEVAPPPAASPSAGAIDFRHTEAGLVTVNWASTPPPPEFPILCAAPAQCGNSLSGALYLLIWGSRSPTLLEPLLRGARWNTVGGADNDVASANHYVGRERITVPAFPHGVRSAKVESEVTQAGALGDPFGSGVRTVHWVRGVGPVKITFEHAGGEVSEAVLVSTNLAAMPLPPDANLLPLNRGDRATYRWRNSRHMRRWSTQRFTVTDVVNNTARVDVEDVSGPIDIAGAYTLSTRLTGVTHLSAFTRSRTRAKFPPLGPRSRPRDRRRRFLTPFDFMVYGFNPVVPVRPATGDSWRSSRQSRDFRVFGVHGRTRVVGTRRVRVGRKRYRAVVVRSTLRQPGFRFGSGTRTSWFVPGRGLVKLVFRHSDRSVSTVERIR